MPARCRYLQRALDVFLSLHVGKVRQMLRNRLYLRRGGRLYLKLAAQKAQKLVDIFHGVDAYPLGKGRLACVIRRDEEFFHAAASRRYCHGQRAVDRTQLTAQRELTDKGAILPRLVDISVGGQYPDKHRQIVERARLFLVRRGKIYRHAADRKAAAVIFYRGSDALARLLDRGIRQTHHVKGGQTVGDIHLQQHLIAAYAL